MVAAAASWLGSEPGGEKRQPGDRFTLPLRLKERLRATAAAALSLFQSLTGASECVALGMDQMLDLQSQLNIAAAVEPLAGSALVGFELRKLRLPKAQDIGFDATDAGDVANLEVEAVRDCGRFKGALWG